MASVDSELINNDKVSNNSNGVVSPFGIHVIGQGSEETVQDHNEVSNDGNSDVGTAQASKQSKIQKQERGSNAPVNVTSPVNFTVDGLKGIWDVLLRFFDSDFIVVDAIANSHGEIGNSSKSGDEGSQDMKQAFLLKVH